MDARRVQAVFLYHARPAMGRRITIIILIIIVSTIAEGEGRRGRGACGLSAVVLGGDLAARSHKVEELTAL